MQIHWPLVISTACQRAGLGLFICACIANLFGAELPMGAVAWCALAFLAVGGCASIFHLQRPQRFFNAFSNPKSHLTQEGLITPLLGIALLLVGFGVGGGVAEVAALILSLAFLLCTGLAYQMKSRPAWNTGFVLALFLLTAAEAGFVGTALAAAAVGSGTANALTLCGAAAIAATICVQLGYIGRMKRVGYNVAYNAWSEPYKSTTLAWLACAAVAGVCMLASALAPGAAIALGAAAEACLFASIAAWTVLFFKGAHKVKMFPMYSVDLNLDM